MNYKQINAYIAASERDNNERLVMQMNVMAVAFGGTAKERKRLASDLLGGTQKMDMQAFENVFQNLATATATVNSEAKEWAAGEFDPADPAFKVNG